MRLIAIGATVFGLVLVLGGSASAQVEEIPPDAVPAPPPGAPPPPPPAGAPPPPPGVSPYAPPPAAPAPPPMRMHRYSRYRSSWYIGFGLGGGGGWVSDDYSSSDAEGGIALQLKVSWVARPWMLVGFEASAFRYSGDPFWYQFNHYDLMATFFPIYDRGFLVKGGIGAGVAMMGASDVFGASVNSRTDVGFDMKLGVGYEWQLMSSFNLGVEAAYGLTAYSEEGREGRTHDFTVQLTCGWY